MEGDGVEVVKQRIDRFCKADHCDDGADPAGDQDGHIEVSDAVHERRIKAKRHEQGGEAHTRCDDAQRQAESAEQEPEEVRVHFYGEQLESDQHRKDHDHAHDHGDERAFAASLFAGLPEQGGQHAGDQSDEDAYGRIRIFLQKEGEDVRHTEESDDASDEYRDQRRDMALKVLKRVGQKFHDRFVDAEDHPEHAAGDAGKHSAQSDERALEDPEDELHRGHFFIQIMIHIFLIPFIYLILFHKRYIYTMFSAGYQA